MSVLHEQVAIKDLFPSLPEGQTPTHLQGEVLQLSQEINVPFAAEPNSKYSNWWRSLHEEAHWAVKPVWYNMPEFGAASIPISEGAPSAEVLSLAPHLPSNIKYYAAGNDVIPTMGMLGEIDPTPSEPEVRIWSIAAMAAKEWEHPFRTILRQKIPPEEMAARGDDGWHKVSTAGVWAPTATLNRQGIDRMAQFGINPLIGAMRPVETGYEPPFRHPEAPSEVQENFQSIIDAHPAIPIDQPEIPEASALKNKYWNIYTAWKQFFTSNTPSRHYDEALAAFDLVSDQSLQLFNRIWESDARKYGHISLANVAASLAVAETAKANT